MTAALLTSPCHDEHIALGATMSAFGGWQMPLSYAGGGVVAEHNAVRERVGLFDVSHLGKVTVRGLGAADFVNACLTADLGRIGPGQAQYTLCCLDTGGVLDDLIAYLESPDAVFLVPNAANADRVAQALAAGAPDGLEIRNRHRDFGVFAVQGPLADEVLGALGLPTGLDYMAWADASFAGEPVRVCRTGYTGERGVELLPSWSGAAELWRALLAEIRTRGGLPAGLGARDTLRTEMGYPLHGQDLTTSITPVQAGLNWAVGWRKAAFVGREALWTEREVGPARRLIGLRAIDRGVIRAHLPVVDERGNSIGETTSGTFSPTLGVGIGLALLNTAAEVQPGAEVAVDVRGRRLRVEVVKPPFVPSHVR